jgi:hypothetical protein
MKQNLTLTIATLLTLVLTTFHFTHDILHDADGLTSGEVSILLVIMLVLLYGTVELAGRRAGYIIVLLGGAAAAYMPYLHSMGPGATRWGFFFVWTMLVMGVTGTFAAILAARALWRSRAGNSPPFHHTGA